MDIIYDESGIQIGEAAPIGENRPEVEPTDIELSTDGIEVYECENAIDRLHFIMDYLSWRDLGHGHLYYGW